MKNLQLFEYLTGDFSVFSKMFKKIIEFFAKNWAKLYIILEVCICRGFRVGGRAPEASEFFKILVEKSMETCSFLIIFVN